MILSFGLKAADTISRYCRFNNEVGIRKFRMLPTKIEKSIFISYHWNEMFILFDLSPLEEIKTKVQIG